VPIKSKVKCKKKKKWTSGWFSVAGLTVKEIKSVERNKEESQRAGLKLVRDTEIIVSTL
jgi:hypothetical protein